MVGGPKQSYQTRSNIYRIIFGTDAGIIDGDLNRHQPKQLHKRSPVSWLTITLNLNDNTNRN